MFSLLMDEVQSVLFSLNKPISKYSTSHLVREGKKDLGAKQN